MALVTSTLVIHGTLPGLNEILDARSGHRVRYNEMKKRTSDLICKCIFAAELPCYAHGAHIGYLFREPNKRRDPGNIFAGASKFIEDALVRSRVLSGDGWKGVLGYYAPLWELSDTPGVVVALRGEVDD